MTGNELRQKYLRFFAGKDHLILPSYPLVPDNDPSLLLIGAGIAPFKPFFTGKMKPPHLRIATSQRCIRTGDIEHVGRTARHHTGQMRIRGIQPASDAYRPFVAVSSISFAQPSSCSCQRHALLREQRTATKDRLKNASHHTLCDADVSCLFHRRIFRR